MSNLVSGERNGPRPNERLPEPRGFALRRKGEVRADATATVVGMGRQAKLKQQRRAEREERQRAFMERIAAGEGRGCLFCRRSDGGFTTCEHPIPESLGNTGIVLENGVVCDRCNNTVLSDLDQAVTEFFPISMRRATLGITTKARKFPVAKFSGGTLQTTEPGHVLLKVGNPKAVKLYPWGFNFTVKGHRMTPRRVRLLARALMKSALGCAWLDHGEKVLEPAYDHIRAFVLGQDRPGYLMLFKKGDPQDATLRLTYWQQPRDTEEMVLIVAVSYYGIFMGTDSVNAEPVVAIPNDVADIVKF